MYQAMFNFTLNRALEWSSQLQRGIRDALGLPEHPSPDAFLAALGRAAQLQDRYYDTTLRRVRTWNGTGWVGMGGETQLPN